MKVTYGIALALGAAVALGAAQPVWSQEDTTPGKDASAQEAVPAQNSITVEVAGHLFSEDQKNLQDYWPTVEKRTKDTWLSVMPTEAQPPKSEPGTVRIECVVHTDGRVTNIVLEQRSGRAALDRAASAAITRSAPFGPFPYGISTDHVKVRFTFLYNGGAEATPMVDGVRKPGA